MALAEREEPAMAVQMDSRASTTDEIVSHRSHSVLGFANWLVRYVPVTSSGEFDLAQGRQLLAQF